MLMHLQALAKYKEIHASHPGNVECLRYLVHLCNEMGRREELHKFMTELNKAEAAAAAETKAIAAAQAAAASQMDDQGQGLMMMNGNTFRPQNMFAAPVDDGNVGLNVPVAKGKKVVAKEDAPVVDDWASEPLGEDLLPM